MRSSKAIGRSVGVIGDPHVGNFSRHGGKLECGLNERGRLTLDSLTRATQLGLNAYVILGDLIDSMRPPPQLLAAVRDVLDSADGTVMVLKGNHDSASDAEGDHALGALSTENVRVIERPAVVELGWIDLLLVPFFSGPCADWLPNVLTKLHTGNPTALFMHAGGRDNETAPWLREAHDAIDVDVLEQLMGSFSVRHAFLGNWHEYKRWGDIHQVGALTPTGYSNLGVSPYGRVAVLREGAKVSYKRISGPRFLKLDASQLDELAAAPTKHKLFVEVSASADAYQPAKEQVAALKASGVIADGSVLRDRGEVVTAAKAAKSAAKRSEDVSEAVVSFVTKLSLPEGVDAAAVSRRALKYLAEA